MPQTDDAERMLQLMSIVAPIYTNVSSTAVAGGGDARMGVPATQGGPPAGGNIWTASAGSPTGPPPAAAQQAKAGAKMPPIARPVTLGSLMPLAPTRLCNITSFGPKGWDIICDEKHLACDSRKFPTHDERVALRERLAMEGQLGQSCKNVAHASYRTTYWQNQPRRVRPRTKFPPK